MDVKMEIEDKNKDKWMKRREMREVVCEYDADKLSSCVGCMLFSSSPFRCTRFLPASSRLFLPLHHLLPLSASALSPFPLVAIIGSHLSLFASSHHHHRHLASFSCPLCPLIAYIVPIYNPFLTMCV
eukprot:m.93539 g.93539  ORF g.93539 m.93539 type:complete len:127 (+) comp14704_c0_seq1:62-442(+)